MLSPFRLHQSLNWFVPGGTEQIYSGLAKFAQKGSDAAIVATS